MIADYRLVLSDQMRFFAEPALSVKERFFASLRMTVSEGLRMTQSEGSLKARWQADYEEVR